MVKNNKINMLRAVVQQVCAFLLFIIIPGTLNADGPVTCEAGTFPIGEPASITCNFRTNVPASKRGISMIRYKSQFDRGKDVLLCYWSVETKKYECKIEMANYTFDGVLTEHLTVKIPAVTPEHGGWYKCFFIASEEIKAHPCELKLISTQGPEGTSTVAANTRSTDKGENQDLLPIILSCVCVLIVAAVCCAGLVVLRRRHCAKCRRPKPENSEVSVTPEAHETELMIVSEDRKRELLLEDFYLSNSKLRQLMQVLDQDMSKGLNDETRGEADIKMFPTFVSPSPDGSENGQILVMDLNSFRLRISVVKFQGQIANIILDERKLIPNEIKHGTVEQLFDFITESTNDIIWTHEMPSKMMPLVLVVAFPCEHESLDRARLVKWTKELNYQSADDTSLHTLLQTALERKMSQYSDYLRKMYNIRKLATVAIVNNAVSTLVSVAHKTPNCKIGLILDRGMNACYTEDWKVVVNDRHEEETPHEMIINTELGALGENGCLDFCRTDYDKKLDEGSTSQGSQILEKMVGGMYIGEIVRLVLVSLVKERLLFQSTRLESILFERARFEIDVIAIIEDDTEEPYAKTAGILDGFFGLENYTLEDLRTVREVCKVVCERAALLTAASLAVLIDRVNQPEIGVVVQGNLYHRHPRFRDILDKKTRELVRPELKFYLVSPSDESCIGAAHIGATSVRLRNTHGAAPDAPQSYWPKVPLCSLRALVKL